MAILVVSSSVSKGFRPFTSTSPLGPGLGPRPGASALTRRLDDGSSPCVVASMPARMCNPVAAREGLMKQLQRCALAGLAACMLQGSALEVAPAGARSENYFESGQSQEMDTMENVPGQLSQEGAEASLGSFFAGPKNKEITSCTRTCVPTCIRGGSGAPGLGPLTLRKEIIVFKEGYRSRKYCLTECAQVCSLSINGPPSAGSKQ